MYWPLRHSDCRAADDYCLPVYRLHRKYRYFRQGHSRHGFTSFIAPFTGGVGAGVICSFVQEAIVKEMTAIHSSLEERVLMVFEF
jgi:hypothetical protein